MRRERWSSNYHGAILVLVNWKKWSHFLEDPAQNLLPQMPDKE